MTIRSFIKELFFGKPKVAERRTAISRVSDLDSPITGAIIAGAHSETVSKRKTAPSRSFDTGRHNSGGVDTPVIAYNDPAPPSYAASDTPSFSGGGGSFGGGGSSGGWDSGSSSCDSGGGGGGGCDITIAMGAEPGFRRMAYRF